MEICKIITMKSIIRIVKINACVISHKTIQIYKGHGARIKQANKSVLLQIWWQYHRGRILNHKTSRILKDLVVFVVFVVPASEPVPGRAADLHLEVGGWEGQGQGRQLRVPATFKTKTLRIKDILKATSFRTSLQYTCLTKTN